MTDLSSNPIVVIISTVSALVGVAGSVWFFLTYVRKRFVAPFCAAAASLLEAASMVPIIKAQLFSNGGSSLRDAVDKIHGRLCVMEARERALIQEHDLAIFIADEEGKTTWVNRTYLRLFGVSVEESIGYGWKNVLHADERDAYAHEWRSAVADRREFNRVVRCIVNGVSEHVFKVRAYPMDSAGSNQRGYTGFIEPQSRHVLESAIGA